MPPSGITLISEPIISESIRNWVEIVAIFAAGIWAVWVFVYQRTIAPLRLPPHLVIATNLQRVGRKDSLVAIKAEILVTNKSKTRVEVLASLYYAHAKNISYTGDEEKEDDASFGQTVIDQLNKLPDVASTQRHIQEDRVEIVAAGRLLVEGTWLDPNEEETRRIVFYVSDQFDNVEFHVAIILARDARRFHQRWTLNERGDIESNLYVKLPGFESDPKKRELFEPTKKEHKKMQKRSGLAYVEYVGTISLWD